MIDSIVTRTTAQTLRPYQTACVDAIQEAWTRGKTPLAWLATGGGKTTILAELLVRTVNPDYQRALVFAHTKEIIEQIEARVRNQFSEHMQPYYGPTFAPGIGVVMGANDTPDARIVIATRQSLHAKRLARVMESGPFDVLLIDESHHVSGGSTYLGIVDTLRAANPELKIAGLTATPKRTDKKGLGVLFEEICYKWKILDGIQGGYLSPATRIRVKTDIDASDVRTQEGDYDNQQLVGLLDANNWISLCIEAFQEHAGTRQTLAFFPKVDMSREFARRLNEAGIAAAHIDGTTPKEERTKLLQDYQRGMLRIVSNFGVLTEGFDAPQTSAILLARPTRSETLFTQIIGRGLRMYPGKADCLIIDLTVVDTKALDVGTVLGQMADCTACGTQFWKGLKNCPACGADAAEATTSTKQCPACFEEIPKAAKVCPLCGYILPRAPMIQDDRERGHGLISEYADLFHSMSAAWHAGDGWFSVGLGFDSSAFVIAPPSYAGNTDRLKERMQRGWAMLPALLSDKTDPEMAAELRLQLDQMEREHVRISQYSLYYVPPVPEDINPITGAKKKRPWDAPQPIYLRTNADLAALMSEADREAPLYGSYASAADKSARWRDPLASDSQRSYLKRLGYKAADLPANLGKGDASKLINHKLATARVEAWIKLDKLPDASGIQVEHARAIANTAAYIAHSYRTKKISNFRVGLEVSHPDNGEGVVTLCTNTDKGWYVVVDFPAEYDPVDRASVEFRGREVNKLTLCTAQDNVTYEDGVYDD